MRIPVPMVAYIPIGTLLSVYDSASDKEHCLLTIVEIDHTS